MAFASMQQLQLLQARVTELEKQLAQLQEAVPNLPSKKVVVGLEGLSQKLAGILLDKGFDTRDKVATAFSSGALGSVKGIGASYLNEIEGALKE